MTGRRLGAALSVSLAFILAGCSGPVGVYHNIEGGAIAQQRQPPPGADLPYPNLANVPQPAPVTPPTAQAAIAARVHSTATGVSPASPAALAGLELPTAAPPPPNVPGLHLPATPSTPPPSPVVVAAAPPKPPNGIPVSLGFPRNSAVLPFANNAALQAIAIARGPARILVGGFGDGTLTLALARAQRLADALTANGVPPGAIDLVAMASGSGGFVQLVY